MQTWFVDLNGGDERVGFEEGTYHVERLRELSRGLEEIDWI